MDFRLSDEQRMLDESAARFLEAEFPFNKYRDSLASRQVFDQSRWQKMAELGWMACAFPESVGGFGGTLVDAQLIARRMGERLSLDPWLSHVVVPGKLLEFLGTGEALALLSAIVGGDARVVMACYEASSHHDPLQAETRLTAKNGEFVLRGRKSIVDAGSRAEHLLVTARDDLGNLALVNVPSSAEGISFGPEYGLLDGTMASEVVFDDVIVGNDSILAAGNSASTALGRAIDVGGVLACADMFGSMSAAFQKTLEYARTRKQFGAAIGSFQVIQHYLVDMFIELQQAESMVLMAGIKADTDDREIREHAASTAKAYVCKSAVFVTQKAIQIHGGIGVTEELEIGHYFRRVTRYACLYGDRDHHLRRLMNVHPDAGAAK